MTNEERIATILDQLASIVEQMAKGSGYEKQARRAAIDAADLIVTIRARGQQ